MRAWSRGNGRAAQEIGSRPSAMRTGSTGWYRTDAPRTSVIGDRRGGLLPRPRLHVGTDPLLEPRLDPMHGEKRRRQQRGPAVDVQLGRVPEGEGPAGLVV